MGHAEARQPLTALQRTLIVDFTRRLYTTQVFDVSAGYLSEQGALGNPETLSRQPFFLGINDPDGGNPTKAPFNPAVFTIFNAWTSLNDLSTHTPARRAVARGQAIFNTRQFTISGVGGLNDVKGGPIQGTCSSCHNSPNAGNRSVATSLNIGVADGIRRTPDMPLYTLRCTATGKIVHTTDPGRALVTGKCADIGKFKVPGLRGIAARAPYFHDGSAATLRQVVDRYNQRFSIGLAPKEVADLVVFLRSQ
jgi:hypothetical protein